MAPGLDRPFRLDQVSSAIKTAAPTWGVGVLLALVLTACSPPTNAASILPATAANAVARAVDFPAGVPHLQCDGSGAMDPFLASIEADDASTFETNKREWEAAKQDGALAAEVTLYSDTSTDCDSAFHSGAGAISSPTAPLLVSVAEQYNNVAGAEKAYGHESIWGLSASQMKADPVEGTVQGPRTGLGSNSIAMGSSFLGAPIYVALWQNRNLMLFMLAINISTDQSKLVARAENARVGRLRNGGSGSSARPTAAMHPVAPRPLNCSLPESNPRVIAIASGSNSLALKSDGSVWAWGRGDKGQLGDGATTDSNLPVRVDGLNCTIAIAVGADHDIALRMDGSVWAWGGNTRGQLGDSLGADSKEPVAVTGLGSGVVAIGAGDQTSLALKSDGSVWAWGRDDRGQLGDGKQSDSAVPVPVSGLALDVTSITAGDDFGIALKEDGSVWGWGSNFSGQLGKSTGETINPAMRLNSLGPDFKAISAGGGHVLGLMGNGSLWAWGKNSSGELGDGTTNDVSVPVQVKSFATGATAIAAGTDGDSVAVKPDGSVWAWGWGAACQLGNGSSDDRHVPTPVTGLSGVTAVAAGSGGGLALGSDGSLWAWGTNNHGELGNGLTDPEGGSCIPVEVAGLK